MNENNKKNTCDEEAQLFKKKPISATNKSVLDRSDCIVVGSRSSRFIFSFVSSKVHPMKSVIVIFTFYLVFFLHSRFNEIMYSNVTTKLLQNKRTN